MTIDTTVSMIAVLVLCIILVSGYIGYRIGWQRCAEYVINTVPNIEDGTKEENDGK